MSQDNTLKIVEARTVQIINEIANLACEEIEGDEDPETSAIVGVVATRVAKLEVALELALAGMKELIAVGKAQAEELESLRIKVTQ